MGTASVGDQASRVGCQEIIMLGLTLGLLLLGAVMPDGTTSAAPVPLRVSETSVLLLWEAPMAGCAAPSGCHFEVACQVLSEQRSRRKSRKLEVIEGAWMVLAQPTLYKDVIMLKHEVPNLTPGTAHRFKVRHKLGHEPAWSDFSAPSDRVVTQQVGAAARKPRGADSRRRGLNLKHLGPSVFAALGRARAGLARATWSGAHVLLVLALVGFAASLSDLSVLQGVLDRVRALPYGKALGVWALATLAAAPFVTANADADADADAEAAANASASTDAAGPALAAAALRAAQTAGVAAALSAALAVALLGGALLWYLLWWRCQRVPWWGFQHGPSFFMLVAFFSGTVLRLCGPEVDALLAEVPDLGLEDFDFDLGPSEAEISQHALTRAAVLYVAWLALMSALVGASALIDRKGLLHR